MQIILFSEEAYEQVVCVFGAEEAMGYLPGTCLARTAPGALEPLRSYSKRPARSQRPYTEFQTFSGRRRCTRCLCLSP